MPSLPPAYIADGPLAWIRTASELSALAERLAAAPEIAVDSESDSLHHFPEKVCLVQLADHTGAVWLLDPLALTDLAPLAPVFAAPACLKIFHGASYDLAAMKRDFGFTFDGIFDTMLAAQLLGRAELGLDALLAAELGIQSGPSRQKDDWSLRPLSPAQETYAAADVRHLLPLRIRLQEALTAVSRLAWLEEECRALCLVPSAERSFDPDACFALKGARALDPRGLAVLRALFVAREHWARERGRPPFKILGSETLVRLAAERPGRREALVGIPGCTPKVLDRYGTGILAAVAAGLSVSPDALPEIPRPVRPRVPGPVQRRMEALAGWRAQAAARLSLDPGVLLPRRLIDRLAQAAPASREELAALDGLRDWRVVEFGDELLAAMRGPTRRGAGRAEV
jgi:ribonuclease D